MKQRERILGIGVGLSVAALVAFFIVTSISSAFESRQKQKLGLESELAEKERTILAGTRAENKFKEFQKQSLPGDPALAGALYSQWLLKKAVETGLNSPDVSPSAPRPHGDIYFHHTFQIDGQANLKQVTEFLYEFYKVGYLHRISRLKLTPIAGKKDLIVGITVEALSLRDAPNPQELTLPPSTRFADKKIEPYMEAIVGRNLFSSGNNVPKLASLGTQKGNPKRSMNFTLKGTDADPLDKLSYSIEGEAPPGAKLDEKSGEFRWTPDKIGEYEVAVRVTDDGLPAKSTVEKVKLSVVEAPPPVAETPKKKKLDFDPAQHAYVTASVQANGKWMIWVNLRTEGKVLRFAEGDKISLGSINGVVKTIREHDVELTLEDGSSVTIRSGKPLASEESSSGG